MGCTSSKGVDKTIVDKKGQKPPVAPLPQTASLLGREAEVKQGKKANREQEALEFKKRYPGNPYSDMENTRFSELLRTGKIAVVEMSYFVDCLNEGVPFQDRASIPAHKFIDGEEMVKMWKQDGAQCLVIFSYAWLTAEHPDPNMYHLETINKILWSMHWSQFRRASGSEEIGVIIDYCSLWQRGHGDKDKRTAVQIEEFSEGLKEINTPYAHSKITAIKLLSVPEEVQRKYEDRGWTLFESIVIDGKERDADTTVLEVHKGDDLGEWGKRKSCERQQREAEGRKPPMTPERFKKEMDKRKKKAESKGVPLFTNGRDQPFIMDKFVATFEEQAKAKECVYSRMDWGDSDMELLAEFLKHCKDATDLWLSGNEFGPVGVEKIAEALPHMPNLSRLYLDNNVLGDDGIEKLAKHLADVPNLKKLSLNGTHMEYAGAKSLAKVLPRMPKLVSLEVFKYDDKYEIDEEEHFRWMFKAKDTFKEALPHDSKLVCNIEEHAKEVLAIKAQQMWFAEKEKAEERGDRARIKYLDEMKDLTVLLPGRF